MTLPDSGTLIGPLSVNSFRVAFTVGTWNAMAAQRRERARVRGGRPLAAEPEVRYPTQ
ncbi:hypothetical protein Pve01_43960 [Planomonospora venezuelensis]|nr:hypothetical protein Pve01_43960 [Planomonospora venezuelensis]